MTEEKKTRKISKNLVFLCVLAYASLIWGAQKFQSMVIVNSSLDNSPVGATTPSTGNFTSVTASNYFGAFYGVNSVGTVAGSAGYTGYNNNSTGDMDFFAANGGASPSFYWYYKLGGSLSAEMWLDQSAILHVPNGIDASIVGNISGTAQYASQLAATPSQCGTGSYPSGISTAGNAINCQNSILGNAATATTTTGNAATATQLQTAPSNCGAGQTSYGIGANGNALCNSSYKVLSINISSGGAGICTTGTGAYQYCSNTYNYSSDGTSSGAITFSSSPSVVCSVGFPQGTSAVIGGFYVDNITTTSFTTYIMNTGTSGGEGATTANSIHCTASHN